jgi:hypothetical protein
VAARQGLDAAAPRPAAARRETASAA